MASAGVSAPISWDELEDETLRPDRWDLRSMPIRVAAVGDLFAGALVFDQELPRLGIAPRSADGDRPDATLDLDVDPVGVRCRIR